MHETLSPNVLLSLDEAVKVDSNYYALKGWAASSLGKVVEFWICDEAENKLRNVEATFYARPDVVEFYPSLESVSESLGFKFTIGSHLISSKFIVVLEDGSEHKIGSLYSSIIRKSGFMSETHKDIIVVDDFYADPDAVREFAINNLEFQPSNYHKGQRATERFILDGTKEKLEEIIGRKIINWNHSGYANGIFQFCTADQPIVYHIDTQMLAAMVYLTPDAPVSTGTAMYKSKVTGVRGFPGDTRNSQLYIDTFKGLSEDLNFYDKTQYEMVDTVGNVYNRLVVFNSSNLHAATEYFGDNIHNARFFHMFFFDVE
jgi:hypothetical protein